MEKALFTTAEAAEYLNVSKSLLEHDRIAETPRIKFVRITPNCVRYTREDLDDFIQHLRRNR